MFKRIVIGVCTLLLTLSAAGQQTPDLRVMSFNIERGDLGVKKNRGWERRKDACLKMLQTRKPTLLGLQECNSTQRDDVKACLEGYGHIGLSVDGDSLFHKVSSNPIYFDKAAVSLKDWGTFWFADDPDSPGMFTWTAKKPRNATWGRFVHNRTGREFLYVNMHLQNGADAVLNRALSLRLVMQKISQFNPADDPVIFTGDLNSNAIEGYYTPVKQVMKLAAESCAVADKGSTHSGYTGKSKAGRIDHVFYRGFVGLEFVVDRDAYEGVQYISDHYPVYADLAFEKEPAPLSETPWAGLKADADDPKFTIGTYNMPSSVLSDPSALTSLLSDNNVDVLGVQGLDKTSEKIIFKTLKKFEGGRYVLRTVYSDPSHVKTSKAVGVIYDKTRLTTEQMTPFWLRDDFETPGTTWDGLTCWSGLAVTFSDRQSGKGFFVISTMLPDDAKSRKLSPAPLKNVDRKFNSDNLPSFLLADFNGNDKEMDYLSLNNFWTDTYVLQNAERDNVLATKTAEDPYDWNSKMDFVSVRHFVRNNVIVLSNNVIRTQTDGVVHYPVLSTVVLK